MSTRHPDWQVRLEACLAELWTRPFAWGAQDCVLCAADCVLACTGEDPAAEVRGSYSDAAGAAAVLRARGGLEAIAAGALGAEVPPIAARLGDIGVIASGGRPCLGVCAGLHWLAPGPDGLTPFPIDCVTRAWRVATDEA